VTARGPARGERSTEVRAQVRLALPLAAQQVGVQLMGAVDAAMLGRWSDAALAGASVGNNLLFAVTAIGLGVVMGLDTVVPQALGAGRVDDARRALDAGLRLAVLVGLASTLAVVASPEILVLADVAPDVVAEARPYVYVRALGVVPFLASVALRSYLAAHHVTRPLVVITIASNIVNAAIDLVLIFGVPALGVPALGVIGAGIATTIVQLATLVVYVVAVRRVAAGEPWRAPATRGDVALVARYGVPIGGQLFAEVGIFGVATVLAGRLGELPAAAHAIALNIASFTFSFAVGVASATSVRVGHAIGAGDRALARRRGAIGLAIGLSVMACCAILFVAAPAAIAGAYTGDAAVIASTVPLLQIAAVFQLSDGAQTIAAGALRGLGDTRATLVANLAGHYAIGLPLMLALAFGAGLGAPGLWWGLSVGLTATAIFLVARFATRTRSTT
jgi:MATE family multidrug resistance protein